LSYFLLAALLAGATESQPPEPPLVVISPNVQQAVNNREKSGRDAFLESLEALGNNGDDSALELLGEIYNGAGFGVERNAEVACAYFARVVGKRPDTLHNLASCYYSGEGTKRDYVKARLLYLQAANLGWPRAKCALGNMLIKGQGGKVDIKRGLALCQEAAVSGEANAQTDLGGYLLMGKVTQKDAVAARKWLTAAAEQKQANATFLLGQIFWNGDGIDRDRELAVEWWLVAYDRGRKDAAYHIGRAKFSKIFVEVGGEKRLNMDALAETRQWLALSQNSHTREKYRAKAKEMLDLANRLWEKYSLEK